MYPNNTLAHYITDLPRRIDLSGEWECGLAEIQYPHTWYNIRPTDTWLFLNETIELGQPPNAKISAGYYKSPTSLINHVNKTLDSMSTDKLRAKLSYSAITQKMTLHMTPGTQFVVPQRSALIRMLGFDKTVIESPTTTVNAGERTYTHQSVRGRNIGLTPSATVVAPPKETADDAPYSYHKEAENVVDMSSYNAPMTRPKRGPVWEGHVTSGRRAFWVT